MGLRGPFLKLISTGLVRTISAVGLYVLSTAKFIAVICFYYILKILCEQFGLIHSFYFGKSLIYILHLHAFQKVYIWKTIKVIWFAYLTNKEEMDRVSRLVWEGNCRSSQDNIVVGH